MQNGGVITVITAEEVVTAAKNSFEASFAENAFYNRQTRDDSHLRAILDFIPVSGGMRILDIGTGSGYLSFALAKRYPSVSVTGLDIAEMTLETDRQRAAGEGIDNIDFVSYDGIELPFANGEFDIVVSRYALHHFPDIEKSISGISRVLKDSGRLFISDPAPNSNDTAGFIDEYMRVKKDGHIRFYSLGDWERLCGCAGLYSEKFFESTIRFPRKYERVYHDIMARHERTVVDGYEIKITGDEIFVTERVNNVLFVKRV